MNEKKKQLGDYDSLNSQLEDYHNSEHNQIELTLSRGLLSILLENVWNKIESSILTINNRKDKVLKEDNEALLTIHGMRKHFIFESTLLLDQILQLPFFQEIYDHDWSGYINRERDSSPGFEEGSEEDYHNRFFQIRHPLLVLTDKEGLTPYPSEVRRWCDKYRSCFDEKFWEKRPDFWKKVADLHKKDKGEKK